MAEYGSGDVTPDYSLLKQAESSPAQTPQRPSDTTNHSEISMTGPDVTDGESNHTGSEDDGDLGKSFHNPELPADLLESCKELFTADNIGDTVFSKHWLFTTLMSLIQAVESHASAKEAGVETADQLVDLDEGLQDELCKLWDMSMNESVVAFLLDFKAVEIFTGLLARSKAPRATEICLGILGNMCCNEDAARKVASHERLVNLILMHLNEGDPPTLIETTRCLHTCVSSKPARALWCEAIKHNESVYNNCRFILQSSTNSDLLKNTSGFVDELMDFDEAVCQTWSTEDLVTAVLEAINQVGITHSDNLTSLFHILQLLSTNEKGVVALVNHGEALSKLLVSHLEEVCGDEIVGVLGRENCFASVFSILNTILTAWPSGTSIVMTDMQVMRCMLKCLNVVYPMMHKDQEKDQSRRFRRRRTTSSSHESPDRPSMEETVHNGSSPTSKEKDNHLEAMDYDEVMLAMLYDVMQSLLSDVVQILCAAQNCANGKESFQGRKATESKTEGYSLLSSTVSAVNTCSSHAGRTDKKQSLRTEDNKIPVTLSYLDQYCSRERLYFLVWCLQEKTTKSTDCSSENKLDHFKLLQNAAHSHKLERLSRILQNAEEFL